MNTVYWRTQDTLDLVRTNLPCFVLARSKLNFEQYQLSFFITVLPKPRVLIFVPHCIHLRLCNYRAYIVCTVSVKTWVIACFRSLLHFPSSILFSDARAIAVMVHTQRQCKLLFWFTILWAVTQLRHSIVVKHKALLHYNSMGEWKAGPIFTINDVKSNCLCVLQSCLPSGNRTQKVLFDALTVCSTEMFPCRL